MEGGSHAAFAQHQGAHEFVPCGSTKTQRVDDPTTAIGRYAAAADTQARFGGLNLEDLRRLYEKAVLDARSAAKQEEFMALQLAATLIRKEIRNRGVSPHEMLFISAPAPIDPIARI